MAPRACMKTQGSVNSLEAEFTQPRSKFLYLYLTALIPCRDEVSGMFHHAYEGYLRHAYPYDELRPISCTGVDTWGSYSLT